MKRVNIVMNRTDVINGFNGISEIEFDPKVQYVLNLYIAPVKDAHKLSVCADAPSNTNALIYIEKFEIAKTSIDKKFSVPSSIESRNFHVLYFRGSKLSIMTRILDSIENQGFDCNHTKLTFGIFLVGHYNDDPNIDDYRINIIEYASSDVLENGDNVQLEYKKIEYEMNVRIPVDKINPDDIDEVYRALADVKDAAMEKLKAICIEQSKRLKLEIDSIIPELSTSDVDDRIRKMNDKLNSFKFEVARCTNLIDEIKNTISYIQSEEGDY